MYYLISKLSSNKHLMSQLSKRMRGESRELWIHRIKEKTKLRKYQKYQVNTHSTIDIHSTRDF